jgi:uncharacterized protein (TIGR02265 family)
MLTQSQNSGLQSREFLRFSERVEATPANATVKGMYIDSFLQTLDRKGIPRPSTNRYVSFKDYPLRDYMSMLLAACSVLHPRERIAEALKRQGRLVYPTLASSTVGKVIFSVAGRSWTAALPLTARGYEISLKPGSAQAQEVTENSAIVSLRNVHNFAECFHVGVMEGAMELFRVNGTVAPRTLDRVCDVDLVLNWK